MPSNETLKQYAIEVEVNTKKALDELDKLQKKVDKGVNSGAINKDLQATINDIKKEIHDLSDSVSKDTSSIKNKLSSSLNGINTNTLKTKLKDVNNSINDVRDKIEGLSNAFNKDSFVKFEKFIETLAAPLGELNKTVSSLNITLTSLIKPLETISNLKLGSNEIKDFGKAFESLNPITKKASKQIIGSLEELNNILTNAKILDPKKGLIQGFNDVEKETATRIKQMYSTIMSDVKLFSKQYSFNFNDLLSEAGFVIDERALKNIADGLTSIVNEALPQKERKSKTATLTTDVKINANIDDNEVDKLVDNLKESVETKVQSKLSDKVAIKVPIKGDTTGIRKEIESQIKALNNEAKTDPSLKVDVPIKVFIDEDSMKTLRSKLQSEINEGEGLTLNGSTNISGIEGISSDVSAIRSILSSGIPISGLASGGELALKAGNIILEDEASGSQRIKDYGWLFNNQLKDPGVQKMMSEFSAKYNLATETQKGFKTIIDSIINYFTGKTNKSPLEVLKDNPLYKNTTADGKYAKYGEGKLTEEFQKDLEGLVKVISGELSKEIDEIKSRFENLGKSLTGESKQVVLDEINAQKEKATNTASVNKFLKDPENRELVQQYIQEQQNIREKQIQDLENEKAQLIEKAEIERKILKENDDINKLSKEAVAQYEEVKGSIRKSESINEQLKALKENPIFGKIEIGQIFSNSSNRKIDYDSKYIEPIVDAARQLLSKSFDEAISKVNDTKRITSYIREWLNKALDRAISDAVKNAASGKDSELYKQRDWYRKAANSYKENISSYDNKVLGKTLEEQFKIGNSNGIPLSSKLDKDSYKELSKMFVNTLDYGTSFSKAGKIINSMADEVDKANAVYQFMKQIDIQTEETLEKYEAQRSVLEKIRQLQADTTKDHSEEINNLMANDITKKLMTDKNGVVQSVEDAFIELDKIVKIIAKNANIAKKEIGTSVYSTIGSEKNYEKKKNQYTSEITELKRLSGYGVYGETLTNTERDRFEYLKRSVKVLREEISIYEDINNIQERTVATAKSRAFQEEKNKNIISDESQYLVYGFSPEGQKAYNEISRTGKTDYAGNSVEQLNELYQKNDIVIQDLTQTLEKYKDVETMASEEAKAQVQERIKYLELEKEKIQEKIKTETDRAAKSNGEYNFDPKYLNSKVEAIDKDIEYLKTGTAEANKELEKKRAELEKITTEISAFESEKMSSIFGIKNPEEAQQVLSLYERIIKASNNYNEARKNFNYNNFVDSVSGAGVSETSYRETLQYLDDSKAKLEELHEEVQKFVKDTGNTKLLKAFGQLDSEGRLGFSDELSKYMEMLNKRNALQRGIDFLAKTNEDENGNALSYEEKIRRRLVETYNDEKDLVSSTLKLQLEKNNLISEELSKREKENQDREKILSVNVNKERKNADKDFEKSNAKIDKQLDKEYKNKEKYAAKLDEINNKHKESIELAKQELEIREKELVSAQTVAQRAAAQPVNNINRNIGASNKASRKRQLGLDELNENVNKAQRLVDEAKKQVELEEQAKKAELDRSKVLDKIAETDKNIVSLEVQRSDNEQKRAEKIKELNAIKKQQKQFKAQEKDEKKSVSDKTNLVSKISERVARETAEAEDKADLKKLELIKQIEEVEEQLQKAIGKERDELEKTLQELRKKYVEEQNILEAQKQQKENAKQKPLAQEQEAKKEERKALKAGTVTDVNGNVIRNIALGDIATETTLQKILAVLTGGKVSTPGTTGEKAKGGVSLSEDYKVLRKQFTDTKNLDILKEMFTKFPKEAFSQYRLKPNKSELGYNYVSANGKKATDEVNAFTIQQMEKWGVSLEQLTQDLKGVAEETEKISTASNKNAVSKKEEAEATDGASKASKNHAMSLKTMQEKLEASTKPSGKNDSSYMGRLNSIGNKPLSSDAFDALAKEGIANGFIAHRGRNNSLQFKQPWQGGITDKDIALTNEYLSAKKKLTREMLESEKAQRREAAAQKNNTEESKAGAEAAKQRKEATKQFVDELLKGRKKTKEYSFDDIKEKGLRSKDVKAEIASRGWEARGNQTDGYIVKTAEAWGKAADAAKDYQSASKKALTAWVDEGDSKAADEIQRREEKRTKAKKDTTAASQEAAQAEREEGKAAEQSAEQVVQAEEKKDKAKRRTKSSSASDTLPNNIQDIIKQYQVFLELNNRIATSGSEDMKQYLTNTGKYLIDLEDQWTKLGYILTEKNGKTGFEELDGDKFFPVKKFTASILENTPELIKAITTVAKIPEEVTREVLQIHSPSKTMEKLGFYVDEGLAEGVLNNKDLIKDAMIKAFQGGIISKDEIKELAEWTTGKDNGKSIFDMRKTKPGGHVDQFNNLTNVSEEMYGGISLGIIKETTKEQERYNNAIERTNQLVKNYQRDLDLLYKKNQDIFLGNKDLGGEKNKLLNDIINLKDTAASEDQIDRIKTSFENLRNEISKAKTQARELAREEAKDAEESKKEAEIIQKINDIRDYGKSSNAEKAKADAEKERLEAIEKYNLEKDIELAKSKEALEIAEKQKAKEQEQYDLLQDMVKARYGQFDSPYYWSQAPDTEKMREQDAQVEEIKKQEAEAARLVEEGQKEIDQWKFNTNELSKAYADLVNQEVKLYNISKQKNVSIKQLQDEEAEVERLRKQLDSLSQSYKNKYSQNTLDSAFSNISNKPLEKLEAAIRGNTQKILSKYENKIEKLTPGQYAQVQQLIDQLENLDSVYKDISAGGIMNYISAVKLLQEELTKLITGIGDSGIINRFDKIDASLTKLSDTGFQSDKIDLFINKINDLKQRKENLFGGWTGSNEDLNKLKQIEDELSLINTQAKDYKRVISGKEFSPIDAGQISNVDQLAESMMKLAKARNYSKITLQPYDKAQDHITITARNEKNELIELTGAINKVNNSMYVGQPILKQNVSFWKSYGATLKQAFSTFGYYLGFAALVRKTMQEFRQGVTTLKEFDSALTTISYTMQLSQKELTNLGASAIEMAEDLSMSIENALKIYQIYANMQTTAEEIQEVAKPTAILSNLSGVDASTAADQVQGILQQFNMLKDGEEDVAETSMHVVDVLDKISANIAVDYSKGIGIISEAVTATGQVAHDAGMSFEELAAITAKVAERTREDGSTIGNAMKTMFVRISKVSKMPQYADEVDNEQISKAAKALHDIGIEVYNTNGEFNNITDTLTQLNEKWGSLNDVQKSNISFQVAATRQSAKFKSMLEAWVGAMDLAKQATEANGNALENQEKFEESYVGKLQRLETEWKEFWLNLLNSDGFKKLLDVLTELISKINDFADSTSNAGIVIAGLGLASIIAALSKMGKQWIINATGIKALGTAAVETSAEVTTLTASINAATAALEANLAARTGNTAASTITKAEAGAMLSEAYIQASGPAAAMDAATYASLTFGHSLEELQAIEKGTVVATGAMTGSIKAGEGAMLGTATAASSIIPIIIGIVGAVALLTTAWNKANTTVKEAEEQLEETKRKLSEVSYEIQELNAIEDKTDAQERRLNLLNKEKTVLERIKQLREETVNKEKFGTNFTDRFDNDNYKTQIRNELEYYKKDSAKDIFSGWWAVWYDGLHDTIADSEDDLKKYTQKYHDVQNEMLSPDFDDYDDDKKEEIEANAREISDKYIESVDAAELATLKLEELILQMEKDGVDKNDDDYKYAVNKLQSLKSMVKASKKELNIYDFFDSDEFYDAIDNDVDALKELINAEEEDTDVVQRLKKKYPDLIDLLDQEGISIDTLIDKYIELSEIREKASNKVDEGFSKSEMIDTISDMTTGFDKLDEIYADITDKGSFDFAKLDTKKFKEAFDGLDEEYLNFIETVSSSPDDISKCQKAFDDLVSAYIDQSGILNHLTEQNKELVISRLKSMGVANAEEIVTHQLTQQLEGLRAEKAFVASTSKQLESATIDEINAFADEQKYSEETRQALIRLALQKQLVNGTTLNFDADISNIIGFVEMLGGAVTALQRLQDIKNGISKNLTDQGWSGSMDEKTREKQLKVDAQAEVDKVLANFRKTNTQVQYSGADKTRDAIDKANKSGEESKEIIDWIEKALQRMEEEINRIDKTVSATYKNWSDRNGAIKSEISAITREISMQQQAYESYLRDAAAIPLAEEYKKLVREGAMYAETITDKNLKKLIDQYTELYDKAIKAQDAIIDLNAKIAALAKQKFDNVKSEFEGFTSEIEHFVNMIDKELSHVEAMGKIAGKSFYEEKINKDAEQLEKLKEEREALVNALEEAESNGIEKGSADWITMRNDIYSVDEKIQELTYDMEELKQKIIEVNKLKFDDIKRQFDGYLSNIQHFRNMIDKEMSHVENMGDIAGKSFYRAEIKQNDKELEALKVERKKLMKQLEEAEKDGLEKGSPEWLEMRDAIYAIDEQIVDVKYETEELKKKMKEVSKLRFDDFKAQFEQVTQIIQNQVNSVNSVISLVEKSGHIVSTKYYENLIKLNKQNISTLHKEYNKLQKQLTKAMEKGDVKKYSNEW